MPEILTLPKLRPHLAREMAAEDQAERRAPLSSFLEDPHPSRIVRERSRKHSRSGAPLRDGELWDYIEETDADLHGIIQQVPDAVLEIDRLVVARDGTPPALEARDLCAYALEQIRGLSLVLGHQLQADARGHAICEIVWEEMSRGPYAGAVLPVALIDRPEQRFVYSNGERFVRRPDARHLPAPPGKFLVARANSLDNPRGRARMNATYWFWHFKKLFWQWYLLAVEKWAQPTAYTEYDWRNNTTEEAKVWNETHKQSALRHLKAIQGGSAFVVPKGMVPKLLEAVRQGAISYTEGIAMCTRGMALVFLGQINTSGLRPGVGAFASEQVSFRITKQKVRRRAHDLEEHIDEDLFRLIVDVNLGPDVPSPHFILDTRELEDRKECREALGEALDRRILPISHRQLRSVYGVDEIRPGEAFLDPGQPAPEDLEDLEELDHAA